MQKWKRGVCWKQIWPHSSQEKSSCDQMTKPVVSAGKMFSATDIREVATGVMFLHQNKAGWRQRLISLVQRSDEKPYSSKKDAFLEKLQRAIDTHTHTHTHTHTPHLLLFILGKQIRPILHRKASLTLSWENTNSLVESKTSLSQAGQKVALDIDLIRAASVRPATR